MITGLSKISGRQTIGNSGTAYHRLSTGDAVTQCFELVLGGVVANEHSERGRGTAERRDRVLLERLSIDAQQGQTSACCGGRKRDTGRICCCGSVLRRRAAGRPPLSIDISCPPGAQQQTRRTPLLRSIDGIDRQTHRRTDIRPLHRPCSAYYADNVNNQQVELLVHNAGLSATGVGRTFSCACLSLSVCLPVLLTKTSRAIRTKCDRLDI